MSDLIGAKTPRKPTDSKDSLESTQVTDQDRASLCAALPHANPRVLGTVLGHMTGDMKWLTEPYQRALHGAATTAAGDGLECQRREMLDALLPYVNSTAAEAWRDLSDAEWSELANFVTDDYLPTGLIPKLVEDVSVRAQSGHAKGEPSLPRETPLKIVIIGAGMAGLAVGMKLSQAGLTYEIFEKNSEVGGVWWENQYPDCGLDTPPHLYAWTALPNADWTSQDVKRDEILDYVTERSVHTGVRESVTFNTEVLAADYETATSTWRLTVNRRDQIEIVTVDVVITAVGILNRPKFPDMVGDEVFGGTIVHTSRWPDNLDLKGKSVGLVGTGSSGIQVTQSIAAVADSLTIFQRSPAWIAPRTDEGVISDGERWLYRSLPLYAEWERFRLFWEFGDKQFKYLEVDPEWSGPGISAANEALRFQLTQYIHSQIGDDPELLNDLVPKDPPYGKRLVMDNNWYQTLLEPHVRLVRGALTRLERDGAWASDGSFVELDVIVFASGFHGTEYFWPLEIRGRSGMKPSELAGAVDDARAYLGVVMPDFPNFFSIQGPNSAIGHGGGATFVAESQAHYIAKCIESMVENHLASIECRQDVCDKYNRELDARIKQMVWTQPGLVSRYRNKEGRVVTNHPWTLLDFWTMTHNPDLNDFTTQRRE